MTPSATPIESGVPGRRRLTAGRLFSGRAAWIKVTIVAAILVCCTIIGQRASPLLLGGLVAAAGLLLVLREPVLSLAMLPVMGMMVPLEIRVSTSVTVNPAVLIVPLVLAIWVLDMARRRKLRRVPSITNLPAVAFVLSATVSLLLGNVYWDPFVPRPYNVLWIQLGQWSIFAFSIIAFWLAANMITDLKSLKLVTYTYLGLGGALAILYTLPLLEPIVAAFKPVGATSTAYWVWLTALAGGLLLFNRQLPLSGKLFCIVTLVVLWYLAVSALSDWVSGFAPMLVTTAVLIALRYRKRALAIFLVVGLLAVALSPVWYQRSKWEYEWSLSGISRLKHYRFVLEFAMRRPWFGLGMAAYRHYTRTAADRIGALMYQGVQISAHNNYLDIFAQMGAVGLATFAWLSLALGRVGWRASRRFRAGFDGAYANAALAGLAGTLVSGLLGDWFLPFVYNVGFEGFRSSVMTWVFLGGLVALGAMSDSSRREATRV